MKKFSVLVFALFMGLTVAQAAPPNGGDKKCTYESKDYSPGAEVDMPSGPKTCRVDGRWE